MAAIEAKGNQWRVRWRDAERQRHSRSFASKGEAAAFAATLPGPQRSARRSRAEMIAHLAANFEVSTNGCWLWTASRSEKGYGRINWKADGVNVISWAHRVVLASIGQTPARGLGPGERVA